MSQLLDAKYFVWGLNASAVIPGPYEVNYLISLSEINDQSLIEPSNEPDAINALFGDMSNEVID